MLRKLNLLPVYDSSEHDLIRDLIIPLLSSSVLYMRGVGFFSSGWLRLAAQGIARLIENGGDCRFVVSPILDERDWEALQTGTLAQENELLRRALKRNLLQLSIELEQNTLNTLAWMVADGLLEFSFAVPKERARGGQYHDKVGVFVDREGDQVAIHGSFNDTVGGSLNGEAFSVFKSWEQGQQAYVRVHYQRLKRLQEEGNDQFRVVGITDAVKEEFVRLRASKERPYIVPANGCDTSTSILSSGEPIFPLRLYPFQEEAIEKWNHANCMGVWEMATGTGKTVTALAAAVSRIRQLGRLFLVILVPYLHLLDQWKRKCEEFGFFPVLCSSEHRNWHLDCRSKVQDFNTGVLKAACLLAVHDTAATERFRKACRHLDTKLTMIIGDEAHALGAPTLRQAMIPDLSMRLGLSATPRRWFDETGTERIFSYFGQVCYEFPLEKAIGKYLTPYTYHPIIVGLSSSELEDYETLTQAISTLKFKMTDKEELEDKQKHLLLKRARIIGGAERKIPRLLDLIKSKICLESGKDDLRHVLIYCAPGSHRDVLRSVAGLGLRCHEFVHTVSLSDREKILTDFTCGNIQVLVAIKCLDEGVDVPSTRTAFFLASTTNPREFVQRRGRILRLFEGKSTSELYDFIVAPDAPSVATPAKQEIAKSILRREMPRFAEFSTNALNQFQARATIRDLLDAYGMLHLLDERPWELYREIMRDRELDEHA